jgi:hypothetical protein
MSITQFKSIQFQFHDEELLFLSSNALFPLQQTPPPIVFTKVRRISEPENPYGRLAVHNLYSHLHIVYFQVLEKEGFVSEAQNRALS